MNTPTLSDLNGASHKTVKYIKAHWPEFYEYLQTLYPNDTLPCQLYMYFNNIPEHPKCVCGKLLEYRSPKLGFRKFCSIKCATNSEETQLKAKETNQKRYGGTGFASNSLAQKVNNTNMERYGVENAMNCQEVKEKLENTNIQRYGVKYILESEIKQLEAKETQIEKYGGVGMGSSSIRKKIEHTQIEKYGGVGLQSKSIRDRGKRNNIKRYGVEYNSQRSDVIEKSKSSRIQSIKKKYPIIQSIEWDGDMKIYICSCPHPESCNKCSGRFKIFNEQFYRRIQDGTELCTVLLPYQHPHQSNTSVEVFIKMILEKHNITYIQSDRNNIQPQELDFYIPSHNIGIECNGVRWHSTEYKDSRYHLNKFNTCKQRNIQLLSIWEDWIVNSPKVVESLIINKLGLTPRRIYARKCNIISIPHSQASDFLLSNHIQGPCNASVHYGLMYDGELVSLMSFGKRRPGMGNKHNPECELLRFCNKLNTSVVGGASKLLKHFMKEHLIQTIVSFSSNDISDGHLYKTLGFKPAGSNLSYWYVGRNFKRYHRFTFCKAKLVKLGYDPNKTEKEIMRTLPYYCIYDSGQTKWVLNNETI